MLIELREQGFNAWQELQQLDAAQLAGSYGACTNFIGTMRDFNEGDAVSTMTLEHYPGMTERELSAMAEEARVRWDLNDLTIIHRVGDISPGDHIVLIAVWSAHREAAFAACRYLIEALKQRATFWKKEVLPQGERWVGASL